jgi:hypothetical protein
LRKVYGRLRSKICQIQIFGRKRTVLAVNKYLCWLLNFQNVPMMRCRLCYFLCGLGENIFGEVTIIGDISKEFLCSPRCFLLVHCVNSWFLLVYCSSSRVFFKIWRPFEDRGETEKKFLRPSNFSCLFIDIYWSVGEAILKWYWRELYCDLNTFLTVIMSPRCFHLNAWKIAIRTAQRRLILKVQKPVEVHIYTKYLDFYLMTQSF